MTKANLSQMRIAANKSSYFDKAAQLLIQCGVALLLVLTTTALAEAQVRAPWTCSGSTGTVDETSYNLTRYHNGAVTISDSAPIQAKAIIRYNITATDGLSWGNRTVFKARIRDNGGQSRVVLYLKAYNLQTGETKTLVEVDSDGFPQDEGYRVVEKPFGGPTLPGLLVPCVNDFTDFAYYIEAHLIRTGPDGEPGLGLMQLYNIQIWA